MGCFEISDIGQFPDISSRLSFFQVSLFFGPYFCITTYSVLSKYFDGGEFRLIMQENNFKIIKIKTILKCI